MALIDVKHLNKSYGNKIVLKDTGFSINRGEIVGLLGRNGVGKTTILKCIAGIIFPTSGKITMNDQDLSKNGQLRKNFGILIDAAFFDYLNVYDNLRLLMETTSKISKKDMDKKIDSVLKLVDLSNQKYKYVRSFSFGMKQRLGLAQTMLDDNVFFMLDEPFVGLDPLGREMMKNVITSKAKKENCGVLFSSHDLDDVLEICDRVIIIKDGEKIYDDPIDTDKSYQIRVSDLSNEDIVYLLEKFQCDKNLLKNKEVSFKVTRNISLDNVLDYLRSKNISILDIDIIENSLIKFFR